MKQMVKMLTPPVLWKLGQRVRGSRGSVFDGDFFSWQSALDAAGGYDTPAILDRVREAALKVKRGEAVFERDSVCFDYEEYRWPTLACLLRIAAENGGKLRVIDFGGSLGSFYFQHRKHFRDLKQVRWSVVEQSHYVACGRKEFQDDVLRFYETIEECMAEGSVDVIFCSSVLEYLEKPYDMLANISRSGAPYILLDRTPFIMGDKDRLTVQHVPDSIYSASYPAWFFSSSRFEQALNHLGLKEIIEFDGEDDVGIGAFKGILLVKS